MPQTLTTNPSAIEPRAMPFDSSVSLARSKRGLLLGAGLLCAALGAAWLATGWLATPTKPKAGLSTPLDRAAIARLDLSGFQKKGTLLIGETTTPSGARLRLVLDARTHELVGMRVIEDETPTK